MMASVQITVINDSHHFEQISYVSVEKSCKNCLKMKEYIQELTTELKSAQLIIMILQDERKSNMPEHTTIENTPTHVNSIEWKLMSTNKDRVIKPTPIQQFQPQPIPTIINRYSIPDNLNLHSQTHQPCEQINIRLLPKEKVNRITMCKNNATNKKKR